MEPLKIKRSLNSLEVSLDDSGKFSFTGRSYPENAPTFFKPINDWLLKYIESPAPKTELTFEMEYFNSASRKCVMEMLRILEPLQKNTQSVSVIWNYEEGDETMKETGEEYRSNFKFDFVFNPL